MTAETLPREDRVEEALGPAREATELIPDSGVAHFDLVQVLAARGGLATARQEAEVALRILNAAPEFNREYLPRVRNLLMAPAPVRTPVRARPSL